MNNYHNIDIDEIELLDDEHTTNVEVVSLNLDDFNERFSSDIHLLYSVEDYLYYPLVPSQLGELFCDNIDDLLFMTHNPSKDDITFWDDFIQWKVDEVIDKNVFKIWFTDYVPVGMNLSAEVTDYVKLKLNEICASM
jgi:hypothetical protein